MEGRETFYCDHTIPLVSCSEVQYQGYPLTAEKISSRAGFELGPLDQ